MSSDISNNADVVIVGAGIAGLYTAYRLLKKNPAQKIVLFERLNRFGGRLQSDLINIDEDTKDLFVPIDHSNDSMSLEDVTYQVKEEEGGMRFTYDMDELIALMQEVGITWSSHESERNF